MTAYQTLVACHAAIGTIALAAFWSAAFLRKGSPLHRRAGQLFLLAMGGISSPAYRWRPTPGWRESAR